MAYLLCHQPLKGLYILYAVLPTLFVRVSFWTITSLVPSSCPRRSWSLTRTLIVKVIGFFGHTIRTTLALKDIIMASGAFASSAHKHGLVWIEPDLQLVQGEIKNYAQKNNVAAVSVVGYWYGKRSSDSEAGQKADPGEKVVYELHGGGWVTGDASPKGSSTYLCTEMLKQLPEFTRSFAVEYRLSQSPAFAREGPFPAALIDCVTGYNYLVNVLGFQPPNILVMGESCGGNLAIALVRYLITYTPSLPPPVALLLISPTADWGTSTRGPSSSFVKNTCSDFIHSVWTGYVHQALLGNLPESETEGLFTGFPPTFIQVGGAEMTLDGMKMLRDRMEADVGKGVEYLELPDATHIAMAFSWHEPERTQAYERFREWSKSLTIT